MRPYKAKIYDRKLKIAVYEGTLQEAKDYLSNEYIIAMWTNLYDSLGRAIYEGDIIYESDWWWGACFVYLNQGDCGPCKGDSVLEYILSKDINNPLSHASCNLWNGEDVTVLGNIYETPELIGTHTVENVLRDKFKEILAIDNRIDKIKN